MAVINSTQNPFSFVPTGNAVVKPIFRRVTSTGSGTSGGSSTTNRICQADAECRTGEFCDFSNPTFGEDLTNPFGVCKVRPTISMTTPTEVRVRKGLGVTSPIQVTRNFTGLIRYSITNVPANVTISVSENPSTTNTNNLVIFTNPLAAAGPYRINVTVASVDNPTLSATVPVTLIVTQNQLPTADFTFTVNNQTKQVQFRDASSDADGTISTRRWTFGDNTTSTELNPTKTYIGYGTYPVTLTVTDNEGAQNFVTKQVQLAGSELAIFATPKTLRLRRNSSAATQLEIRQTNVGSITFAVNNLPSGVTFSVSNQTLTGATITFTNTGQTVGITNVTIVATGAVGTSTITANETVTINGTYITRVVPSLSSGGTVTGNANLTPTPRLLTNGAIELEADVTSSTSFQATPNTGYRFMGWFLNNDLTNQWPRTEQPATPTARILVTSNDTYTAKFEQIPPGQCIPPLHEQTINVPCPAGTTGTATQRQVRTYDAQAPGPGTCPVTSDWQNSGAPNNTACTSPQFWRNCISGELVEGTPPAGYIQATFTGPAGGVCWEPPGDIAFLPSLSEALRFIYQRGSSTYPTPKTLQISNTSTSYAQRVTLTTDNRINFTQGTSTNAGSISVVIPPRGDVTLTVRVTPQLLQDFQDGSSLLALNVQYQRVIL